MLSENLKLQYGHAGGGGVQKGRPNEELELGR
jgi:hypothetical protein